MLCVCQTTLAWLEFPQFLWSCATFQRNGSWVNKHACAPMHVGQPAQATCRSRNKRGPSANSISEKMSVMPHRNDNPTSGAPTNTPMCQRAMVAGDVSNMISVGSPMPGWTCRYWLVVQKRIQISKRSVCRSWTFPLIMSCVLCLHYILMCCIGPLLTVIRQACIHLVMFPKPVPTGLQHIQLDSLRSTPDIAGWMQHERARLPQRRIKTNQSYSRFSAPGFSKIFLACSACSCIWTV